MAVIETNSLMDVFISSVLKENIQTYLNIQSFFKIPVNNNFFLQYIVLCNKTYSYLSDQTNFLAISLKRRLHALNKSKSSVKYLNFLNQGVNNCFFLFSRLFNFFSSSDSASLFTTNLKKGTSLGRQGMLIKLQNLTPTHA